MLAGAVAPSRTLLMVQVALPENVPSDPSAYLKNTVEAAIDEAARWAETRKVPIDITKLRSILERA